MTRLAFRRWSSLVLVAPLALLSVSAHAQTPLPEATPPEAAPAQVAAPPSPAPAPPPPIVASAPPALAQVAAPQPPAADAPARSPSQWYGWQTLIAVAPFDIALFVGLARDDNRITATGFLGRNVAPSVVHMINRRPGVGFATLGLHAAATATGIVVGYAIGLAIQRACPPGDVCRYGLRELPPGLGYGAVAGSMVGTVLDVVFLARRPRATWDGSSNNTVAVTPFAAPTTLGIAAGGTF